MKEHGRTYSAAPLLPYGADSSESLTPPASPVIASRYGSSKAKSILLDTRRRRLLFLLGAAISVASIVGLALMTVARAPSGGYVVPEMQDPVDISLELESPNPLPHTPVDANATVPHLEDTIVDEVPDEQLPSHSPYLNGPPTDRFRDNLRNDTQYITSWISAGWNNDVMTYFNLLYVAKITDRVPIIGLFTPSHIGGDAAPIPFGEVFDVPRFIKDSGLPMVEWDEVKNPDSNEIENIGCWNIWEAVQYYEHYPRGSSIPDWVGLDISYTRAPDWMKLVPNYEHDKCSTFWALARLGYPEDREKAIGNPLESPRNHVKLDPDEHLLCYDYLYYACAQQSFEWEYEYAPTWRYVGRHMHWTPRIDDIAKLYVNRVFGLSADDPTPAYITVHVRHGDFKDWCWEAEVPEDCFAPLAVTARRVMEVQDEIRANTGVDVPMSRVIMTSDEKDENWWHAVTALQWVRVDHDALQTVATYGRWYPVILDAAIQSNGAGFVGTDRSTFSVLSKRRVMDHGGAVRMVKWGKKGADDHRRKRSLSSLETRALEMSDMF